MFHAYHVSCVSCLMRIMFHAYHVRLTPAYHLDDMCIIRALRQSLFDRMYGCEDNRMRACRAPAGT